jgi:WD40 repeat protein
MTSHRRFLRFLSCSALGAVAATAARAAEVSFVRDLAPLLVQRCTSCHGDRRDSGNFRLHTFEGLMRGGGSSLPSVVPGHPEKSEILALITAEDAEDRMPRDDDALSPAQIELVRTWIAQGAKFDGPDPKAPLKSLLGPCEHPAAPAAYRMPVPVLAVALAPGGREVAVGGYHEVTVWDTASGRLLRRLGHLPQRIHTLAFNREGSQLLVGGGTPGDYGELTLVDAATGRKLRTLDTFDDVVLTACFRADGTRIAAGSADQTVRVFDAGDGHRLWSMKVHSDWVTSVSFSADNRFVASSSKDKTVKIYEEETGTLFTTYNGHNQMIGQYAGQNPVYNVKFTPDSPVACSVGRGPWIQLWEPEKARDENGTAADMEGRFAKRGHARYIAHGFQQEVFGLAVRNGQIFAAAADGLVKQFDLESSKEVRPYAGHHDWVYALDWDAASQRLATGSYDGEVRIWDTASGNCLATFTAAPGFTRK